MSCTPQLEVAFSWLALMSKADLFAAGEEFCPHLQPRDRGTCMSDARALFDVLRPENRAEKYNIH
jgi:hypothetical protein